MKIRVYSKVEFSEPEKLVFTGIRRISDELFFALAIAAFFIWLWRSGTDVNPWLSNSIKGVCLLFGMATIKIILEILAKGFIPYWRLARQESLRAKSGQGTLFDPHL